MKTISLIFSLFISLPAAADEIIDASKTHQSRQIDINNRPAQVVYVGYDGKCDAVSIQQGQHIQNFRVCDGQVIERRTVSPAWDREDGQPTFLAVVKNAIRNGGDSQTDRNGYLIQARMLNRCKSEVIVSYDFDLVEYEGWLSTCSGL